MRISYTTPSFSRALVAAALALVATLGPGAAAADAQGRPVPETYTAITTNMQPAGVELKADILDWSTAEQRAAAIAALESADPAAALRELPTLGIVWRSGSVVGHAIKYAVRNELPDGGEQITLVTDRRIGSTSFTPWVADDAEGEETLAYSVVEFRTGADSGGTLSLAAEISIDADGGLITLEPGSRAPLLTSIEKQPKPYWATAN